VGREDVGVRELPLAVAKRAGLHEAFGDERTKAVVDLAETDAEGTGEIALRGLGLVGELFEKAVADFVAEWVGPVRSTVERSRAHATLKMKEANAFAFASFRGARVRADRSERDYCIDSRTRISPSPLGSGSSALPMIVPG
jgi:hypothetical protein